MKLVAEAALVVGLLGWLGWMWWRDHVELEMHRAGERARNNLARRVT